MAEKAIRGNSLLATSFVQKVQDYKALVKLRLSLTVVFSSVMAYLIAIEGSIEWRSVAILAIGGFLVTAAANTLNQVIEKDYDRLMKRTADRPLAAGRMKINEAVMSAGFMCMFGIVFLALFNPWTSFFGMLSLVIYSFVYTPLKRYSPIAVVVGAIPGALPTLIGCVAAQGEITSLALALFTIQFLWQFPHFWSIAWLGFEDYKKAGYKLMPMKDGNLDRGVGLQSLLYALGILPLAFIPFMIGESGLISCILVAIVSLVYAFLAWNFYKKFERKSALNLMFCSFLYIPFILIVYFLDKM